jgi:hypothetical protein
MMHGGIGFNVYIGFGVLKMAIVYIALTPGIVGN